MSITSDDIVRQIREEIARRGKEPGSLDELNEIAAEVTARYNRTAIADFEGLSPEQMYTIDYKQFTPECPVRFKGNVSPDTVADSPIMKMSRVILDAIKEADGLKLTAKGNLPRRVVNEIYHLDIFKSMKQWDFFTKTMNEFDYYPAAIINALLKVARITKVSKNKLHITRDGKNIMTDSLQLFQALFKTFTSGYNKAYLDYFESDEIGNHGLLYVIYLLNRYGSQKREEDFYARLYIKAFPMLLDGIPEPLYATPEQMAFDCFNYRVFDKGLYLFGLVEMEYTGKDYLTRKTWIKTTRLFHQVFEISC
ncbi:MAG: hypothetical protein JW723_04215 [Bacteroidales bacterium]|nr:hypothetical protein [Bacteroidales bacterium]